MTHLAIYGGISSSFGANNREMIHWVDFVLGFLVFKLFDFVTQNT